MCHYVQTFLNPASQIPSNSPKTGHNVLKTHNTRPSDVMPSPGLNLSAIQFYHSTTIQQILHTTTSSNGEGTPVMTRSRGTNTSNLAKYMTLRELDNTGLMTFDNNLEKYRSCRSTFKAVVQDLSIPPMQKCNQMVRS